MGFPEDLYALTADLDELRQRCLLARDARAVPGDEAGDEVGAAREQALDDQLAAEWDRIVDREQLLHLKYGVTEIA